jgi:hypothetical protein
MRKDGRGDAFREPRGLDGGSPQRATPTRANHGKAWLAALPSGKACGFPKASPRPILLGGQVFSVPTTRALTRGKRDFSESRNFAAEAPPLGPQSAALRRFARVRRSRGPVFFTQLQRKYGVPAEGELRYGSTRSYNAGLRWLSARTACESVAPSAIVPRHESALPAGPPSRPIGRAARRRRGSSCRGGDWCAASQAAASLN